MKTNLKQYSDAELSLVVFNDEYLYNMRRDRRRLREVLDCDYSFTQKQWRVLLEDISEDLKECNK